MDDLKPHDDVVETSTDRSFGFLWAAVFAIIAFWPMVFGTSGAIRFWSLGVAGGILAIALTKPTLFAPLNRAWMRLAVILGKIVTPVVMGLIFFIVVWPIGVLRRLSGADPLHRRAKVMVDSYWVKRPTITPSDSRMKNQF